MGYSPFSSVEKKPLILILDKNNLIGANVAEKLSENATVILVSREQFSGDEAVVFVPFSHTPQIPDGMYASTLFVWDKNEKDILKPLAQKAHEQGAHLFLVVQKEDRKDAKEALLSLTVSATVLVLGDIFGKDVNSPLQNFLTKTKELKKMTLSQMGLHLWYPVLLADVMEKIKTIVFSKDKAESLFFLGPKHPITALSLAHAIQKIDPLVSIDFSKESVEDADQVEKNIPSLDDYDSIEKVQRAYQDLVVKKQKDEKILTSNFSLPKTKSKKKYPWILYGIYVTCIALFLPFLIGLMSGGLGALFLSSSLSDIKKGNIVSVQSKISASRQNFFLAKEAFGITKQELGLIGKENLILPLSKQIDLGYKVSQLSEEGIGLFQHVLTVLQGKTISPKTDIGEIIRITKHLSLLMQEVSLQDVPKEYRSNFLALQKLNTIVASVIDEMPFVLGASQDRQYLILFQNNMELRPGGGFVGSYGLLKLHNGAIKDFSIHDVYDADGQLKGHVEPPFAIRRYIPLVHLYLRDSNFDPDFTKNAQTAAFLLSEETGERVDGVIGIDLETVKVALSAIGSVYVPSYNETVTEKNFFTIIEKHVEKNNFAGSTQKKDFLSAFFASFLDSFQKPKQIHTGMLLEQALQLIQGKHVMIALSDPLAQVPFSLTNLSGTLPDAKATSSAEVSDFLGISEANLGVNKVNAFVSRKLSQTITFDEKGKITETAVLSLINDSDGTWPGGVYRDYIRFILPGGATVKNIHINNLEQNIVPAVIDPKVYEAKSFVPPHGLEVAKEEENGKSLFGFLVTVPEKSTTTVTITYELASALSLGQVEQKYNILLWKQPGILPYPYDMKIHLPNSLGLLKASVPVVKTSRDITYKTTITGDTSISVSLIPQ